MLVYSRMALQNDERLKPDDLNLKKKYKFHYTEPYGLVIVDKNECLFTVLTPSSTSSSSSFF